jgi:hypothetical protein
MTKYLNGHSDVVAGCVITKDQEHADKVSYIVNALGLACSPFDAWLVHTPTGGGIDPTFGTVTFSGLSRDLAPNPIGYDPKNYSIPLTASAWGVSQADWNARLSNVQGISITLESVSGVFETVAFDNFELRAPGASDEEPGLRGWVVYLDQNGNGTHEPTERFVVTTSCEDSGYSFRNLPPGTYTVREEVQSGWTPTAPGSGSYAVNLDIDQVVYGRDFGNRQQEVQNHPPTFTSTAPNQETANHLFRYDAVATDPDGDSLTFSLVVGPGGMSVDAKTGVVVWIPNPDQIGNSETGFGQIGDFDIGLRVRDDRGASAIQFFHLIVSAENTPPQITSSPKGPAVVGNPWQYQVTAQDAEGDAISAFPCVGYPG